MRIDSAVLDFLTRRLLALPMSYFKARRTGEAVVGNMGAPNMMQFTAMGGVVNQGSRIEVSYSGRNQTNKETISLKFSVP